MSADCWWWAHRQRRGVGSHVSRARTMRRCRPAGPRCGIGSLTRLVHWRDCCFSQMTVTQAQGGAICLASVFGAADDVVQPEFPIKRLARWRMARIPRCRAMTSRIWTPWASNERNAAGGISPRDQPDAGARRAPGDCSGFGRCAIVRARLAPPGARVGVPVDGVVVRSKGSSHSTRSARQSDDPDPTGPSRR
jgi:hypothetical protein